MTTVPEYVTKPELDMRLQVITDRQERDEERNAEKFSSMENLLDSKLTMMQLMMEKNLAQYQAIASEMRAELSEMRAENSGLRGEMKAAISELRGEMNSQDNEIRGEMKAIAASVEMLQTKIGWYISFLGIGMTVVVALIQILLK
ncbi:MAG: hypothetical protein IJF90_05335 [Synergistaceae bacterium]|nr:hypothetical protein [Synergistaceae bacterium]MBQ6419059.1 hypothetical protein [Synergistaceae bacterium]MBQ6664806.1 hypothetical protein [Synergistaceae bacterium]MBQ6980888.1 hypothetical protein [Synergistaceae bacterium]